MRLEEPIVANGLFWLPSDPENKVPGTLRVSESGRATLEAMDSHHYFIRRKLETSESIRILGVTNQANVTLDGCNVASWNWNRLTQATIRVHLVYWGAHYEEDKAISFSKVEFSTEHLNRWLHTQPTQELGSAEDGSERSIGYTSGIAYRWSRNEGVVVEYAPPKDISIKLRNGMEMRLCFSYQATPGPFEANITTKPSISLESRAECRIDEFLSLIHKICSFLSFSVDRSVLLEYLTGYSKELIEHRRDPPEQVPVKVYFETVRNSLPQSELDPSDIFLPYEAVKSQLDEVLNKWLECYQADEYAPSINLYSAVLSQPSMFLDVKFLFYAQSLEVLHRRISEETAMPDEEFKSVVGAMLEDVPEHHKEHFRAKLAYANELSLNQRLKILLEEFSELYGISGRDRNSFVRKVVVTRNYLTHYDKSLKSETANTQDLFDLTRKLKSLLQLHFLQLIGMDNESITELTKSNPLYHDLMMRLWKSNKQESTTILRL